MTEMLTSGTDGAIGQLLANCKMGLLAKTIDLNVTKFSLQTNVPNFSAYSFFTSVEDGIETDANKYGLTCIDVNRAGLSDEQLIRLRDRSFRASKFLTGFYLNTYFGDPAYLMTRASHTYIFGTTFDSIVWPFYVKRLLTLHSLEHGLLHLKAGGVTTSEGVGTLFFGRSGAGKTVMLTGLCQAGMSFLSNTHVVLDGSVAHGIPSTMRIRMDPVFSDLIRRKRLSKHLDENEYNAAPELLFQNMRSSATIRNLVIVDYSPSRKSEIRSIPTDRFLNFVEQFSLPINAYGLKDDVMEHLEGDLDKFASAYREMKNDLIKLVSGARLFHMNMDVTDPTALREVLEALA